MQHAEAEMAAGHERSHPKFLGLQEGSSVAGRRRSHIGRFGVRLDLAEETRGPGLVASLVMALSEGEGPVRDVSRRLLAAVPEIRLAEIDQAHRLAMIE